MRDMPETVVVNRRRAFYDVNIDRRSKWGNPFIPGTNAKDRFDAIEKYEDYVRQSAWLMQSLPELFGKRLGCWCKPKPCHGDVLVRLLNELWEVTYVSSVGLGRGGDVQKRRKLLRPIDRVRYTRETYLRNRGKKV